VMPGAFCAISFFFALHAALVISGIKAPAS
jgi:hypothetical protein